MPFDLAKYKSINAGRRTRDKVVEGRREDGSRFKAVTDELNNTVTERTDHSASGVSHHQDVEMRPATVKYKLGEG